MTRRIFKVIIFLLLICKFNPLTAQIVLPKNDSLLVEEEVEEEEGEEESEVDEESSEYDSLIFMPSDRYWDYFRPRNFLFDTTFAPAREFYTVWDTLTINPYKIDLKGMEDTIRIVLANYDDCAFHPPAIGDITSGFGFRRWGRRAKFHFGSDIRMDVGDPVYAAFEGVVRVAKRSSDYGYVVLIRHNNGLETLYAHFSQLLAYPGQPVKGGDIIGLAGSTGRSTGPHLHFEVRFKGEKIDPSTIIHFPTGSLLTDTFNVDKSCFKHLYEVKAAKLKAKKTTGGYYKVRSGDTLYKVSRRFNVSVTRLAKLNRISTKAHLRVGQRLRIR